FALQAARSLSRARCFVLPARPRKQGRSFFCARSSGRKRSDRGPPIPPARDSRPRRRAMNMPGEARMIEEIMGALAESRARRNRAYTRWIVGIGVYLTAACIPAMIDDRLGVLTGVLIGSLIIVLLVAAGRAGLGVGYRQAVSALSGMDDAAAVGPLL